MLLEDLEQDWYEVSELRAPTGYTLDETHYENSTVMVSLFPSGMFTVWTSLVPW